MNTKVIAVLSTMFTAGCSTTHTAFYSDTVDPRKGKAPQSSSLIQDTHSFGSNPKAHSLIRIFKEDRILELWKSNNDGKFVLVRAFDICSFSGHLGPKIKKGDRQAPEGFYSVGPSQLNYNSVEYLSFDTGYPNAFDRSHNRTGSALMIHGGCSSAGCYAIKDAPMQDLFASMRDSLSAGQKAIQLQIYPFRMTKTNMMAHNSNANHDFWLQLKEGYDKFEETKTELKVKVVNGKYVIQ